MTRLGIFAIFANMDTGQFLSAGLRLFLGTVAAFLAIMVWSRYRDASWMFMVFGTLAGWIGTLYGILQTIGVARVGGAGGMLDWASLVLECLPWLFFICAFVVMAGRKVA